MIAFILQNKGHSKLNPGELEQLEQLEQKECGLSIHHVPLRHSHFNTL